MPGINITELDGLLNVAAIYQFTVLTDGDAHKIDAIVTGVRISIVVGGVAILNHNRVVTISRKSQISDP